MVSTSHHQNRIIGEILFLGHINGSLGYVQLLRFWYRKIGFWPGKPLPGNSAGDLFGMVSLRDPFRWRISWPPTFGDKMVTTWITWRISFIIHNWCFVECWIFLVLWQVSEIWESFTEKSVFGLENLWLEIAQKVQFRLCHQGQVLPFLRSLSLVSSALGWPNFGMGWQWFELWKDDVGKNTGGSELGCF